MSAIADAVHYDLGPRTACARAGSTLLTLATSPGLADLEDAAPDRRAAARAGAAGAGRRAGPQGRDRRPSLPHRLHVVRRRRRGRPGDSAQLHLRRAERARRPPHTGAQRELLAAPVPRAYLVLGNLMVAIGLAALQVTVLIGLSAIRGGDVRHHSGRAWLVRRRGAAVHGVHVRGRRDARRAGLPSRRTMSGRRPRWRSCRSSSPARCSRSPRCPAC